MNFLSLTTSLLAVNSVMVLVALSFAVFIFLFLLLVAGSSAASRQEAVG